jgi:hypothetical protein
MAAEIVRIAAMRPSRLVAIVLLVTSLTRAAEHPGNVHLEGEAVRVPVPATWTAWRAIDIDKQEVARGEARDGFAGLGKLPVGYFEVLQQGGDEGKVTAGVVPKIVADADTPIAIDAAMSWFYSDPEQIRDACRLARMAGVTWVRDRASWPELETSRGVWAGETRYERAMRIQHETGLRILQVNHVSPPWAAKDPKKFPEDLRDVFNFYRELAKRWHGLADAIEPWNEPDIDVFGGHTGCEIASFQKAACLGLRAGDPELPVNNTVFAIDRAETLEAFAANDVYPYFDRYDLHHYIRLPEYERAYGRHRAASGGKPMWVTEFNLTVHWADEKTHEPSEEELRVQGYRVGKVFAHALHEGPEKAFYFILGHYEERNLQFGIVHDDLTPRPAYLAFAAVGRLMNMAKPLGRVDLGDEKLKAFAFATRVDGQPRETVVTWSETKPTTVEVPGAEALYDYLGRPMPRSGKIELARATVFAVLPAGGTKAMKITPPPGPPRRMDGKACPVVLQLLGPTDFRQSAFRVDQTKELRLVAYNFGDQAARGTLKLEGVTTDRPEVEIESGGRVERTVRVDGTGKATIRLDLGDAGAAVVSARLTATPPASQPASQPAN